MTTADEVLARMVAWAQAEDGVRAVLVEGSRALPGEADALSDIDVSLFVRQPPSYLHDEAWLSQFAPMWVYIATEYAFEDLIVPTRLVIYEDGVKVDFSLWSVDTVPRVVRSNRYDLGYQVVLDKDQLLAD